MRLSSLIGWTTLALGGGVFVLRCLSAPIFMWIALWVIPRFCGINYFRDIVPISM